MMSTLPKGGCCEMNQAEPYVNLDSSSFNLLHHRPQMNQLSAAFPAKRWGYYLPWLFYMLQHLELGPYQILKLSVIFFFFGGGGRKLINTCWWGRKVSDLMKHRRQTYAK